LNLDSEQSEDIESVRSSNRCDEFDTTLIKIIHTSQIPKKIVD